MQLVLFTADDVRESLKRVVDPELDVNIVDLGLIYAIDVAPNADVTITIAAFAPGASTVPGFEYLAFVVPAAGGFE